MESIEFKYDDVILKPKSTILHINNILSTYPTTVKLKAFTTVFKNIIEIAVAITRLESLQDGELLDQEEIEDVYEELNDTYKKEIVFKYEQELEKTKSSIESKLLSYKSKYVKAFDRLNEKRNLNEGQKKMLDKLKKLKEIQDYNQLLNQYNEIPKNVKMKHIPPNIKLEYAREMYVELLHAFVDTAYFTEDDIVDKTLESFVVQDDNIEFDEYQSENDILDDEDDYGTDSELSSDDDDSDDDSTDSDDSENETIRDARDGYYSYSEDDSFSENETIGGLRGFMDYNFDDSDEESDPDFVVDGVDDIDDVDDAKDAKVNILIPRKKTDTDSSDSGSDAKVNILVPRKKSDTDSGSDAKVNILVPRKKSDTGSSDSGSDAKVNILIPRRKNSN